MHRKLCLGLVLVLCTVLAPCLLSQKKVKEEDLAPRYREWLNLVAYHILPQEKDVFLQLQKDFERDIFIESFWRQRDPTPGTPENEFKNEINERFRYVSTEFSRGTTRPGWMTDRGRIYMTLGAPQSREKITLPELQPCELWSYYGDTSQGQPTYFGLIFFRRAGIGEYTLYSPVGDGPKKLIIYTPNLGLNPDSNWDVVQYIRELAPTLAPYTLSIIPQDYGLNMDPSPRSEIQLAQILESPRKSINPAYATHFLNYRGIVSTEYLTNFVDSEAVVAVMRDPVEGIPFLHFSVAPKSISVDYYQPDDRYFCNYSVDVSLKKGNTFIYQSSREYPYYFSPEDSPMVVANGIAIQDSIPVVEGNYRLTVLLRNSVGREFSLLEKDVKVESPGTPRIGGPMLGYNVDSSDSATLTAFKVFDQRAYVDAKNTYTLSDTISFLYTVENVTEELWEGGEIRVGVQGLKTVSPAEKRFTVPLNRQPFRKILALSQSFPASDLVPDYYEATISLAEGETIVDSKLATFIVSDAGALARPVILSNSFPRSSIYLQYLALADESEKTGNSDGAESYYQKALRLAPNDTEAAAYYSGFLMRAKRYEQALEFIEAVKDDASLRFDYFLIKGKALKEIGRCEEAIPLLLEANKIYNSDTRLLNSLGYCYYRTGQKTRALEALNASLRLDPTQEDIKKLVEEINKD
jgi:GWxTD domain-containing protein